MSRMSTLAVGVTTASLSLVGVTTTLAPDSSTPLTDGVTAGGAPVVAAAAADPELTAAIDALLADPRLTDSMVAVSVRDAGSGEVLYERNPRLRLNPASNAKLFSSAAAVETLGLDHSFTTDVLTDRGVSDGAVNGDLFLRGGGDPTTLATDYRALAADLAGQGVVKVKGSLVADDSYFDDVPLGVAWSWDDEPFYYSAATSALTAAPDTDYDSGTVIVRTTPGAAAGDPLSIEVTPATSAVRIVNQATTGAPGSSNTLSIERQHASDVVLVTGSYPAGRSTDLEWVTVPDPTTYAADLFRRALAAEGIKLKGTVREGSTPQAAQVLASHESMTLGELLTPYLKLSNNMHAEALVKAVGAETSGTGSTSAGLAVVRSYLTGHGIDTSRLRLSDGSGLSRFDLVSAHDLTDLLIAVQSEPWFDTWYDALPIAGNPERFAGGTLRSRMRDTAAANNLHGKTGSLTSVTTLSGYVTNADGRDLVFAMMSNNYLLSPRSIEDALGVTLAEWSEQEAAPAVRPQALRRSTDYGPAGIECSWAKAC
jgi:D-alanyl-D-alanine carboxypeptidase/D-alanyl-D-alanine-endopeptidase (penicillin-binding protein 4)